MIGLDTNILLRLVLKDDPVQTELAVRLVAGLSKENPGYVNCITLLEFTWYLRRRLKLERRLVADTVFSLLQAEDLVFEDEELIGAVLMRMSDTSVEFADTIIALRNKRDGCPTTRTFDTAAARQLPEMELLQ
ncbi:PIN domain-containing protein [Rhizobium sp. TRM95796]|uniref:PIN domain-containing protein n=1 Tax=Rhizobium sp. TRM95796 TaxID=2979862 RepID=UPI0021E8A20B|nr:PIN domain-containing protein [Rhizobium sp. TRM95796]MCV3766136.1 PIN domain-containing protein [Rhizobium sp. TRM95796]